MSMSHTAMAICLCCLSITVLCAQEVDPARLDKAVRVSAATDPDSASYGFLLKRMRDNQEAQQFLTGITSADDLVVLAKQRRCGLLLLAIASLKDRGLIAPHAIRKASIEAIVLQPDQQIVFGQAQPAMCWLIQEDDYADAAEHIPDLAVGFKHPLVASTLLQYIPTEIHKAIISHKDFATLPPETRAGILGMSMKDAPPTQVSPAFDQAVEELADGPPAAQRMYFISAKDRKDPKLVARYSAALELQAKNDINEFWMLAHIGFGGLLEEVNIQNLNVPEPLKLNLLRIQTGQPVKVEP